MPYGDPNDPHYRKNAFDAGEDGLGKNAHSLKKVSNSYFYLIIIFAQFTAIFISACNSCLSHVSNSGM